MPERPVALTRADLPDEFTPDTVRGLPITTLRRLADHRNTILTDDEQRAFDRAMHEVMRGAAQRVSRRLTDTDWSTLRQNERARRNRSGRVPNRADKQLDRLAERIGRQLDLAGTLAPDVDWSFAQPIPAPVADASDDPVAAVTTLPTDGDSGDDDSGTVSDLEDKITEQVELVEVMSDIAEISRRTYALEQQRDLQSTRTIFFGLVVSVAVLVAGWAPLVTASDWTQRLWIVLLTVGTCALAAAVYGVARHVQNAAEADEPQ